MPLNSPPCLESPSSHTVWLQYSSHAYKNEVINLLLGIKVKELALEKGLPSAQIFVWCRSVWNSKFLIYSIQLKNIPTQFGERKSRRIHICTIWSGRLELMLILNSVKKRSTIKCIRSWIKPIVNLRSKIACFWLNCGSSHLDWGHSDFKLEITWWIFGDVWPWQSIVC